MAQPWEQDWSKPAGSKPDDESVPPWERKWGATQAAPAKAQDGQAVSGFKRSFQEVPGMLAGVGAFAADVVGATDARDSMLAYAKKKQDEVGAAHAGDAQSITDAWDGKTSWGDFLANAAGYVAGQALQSILTGGAGALGAKMLASNGIKQIGIKTAAEQIAAGATEEVAKVAAAKAMAEAGSKAAVRGGIAGATAQNLNMELGSIYPDAVEEAGGADKLDGGDRFRVLSASALAAGVDTAGEALTAFKWLKGSTAGGKGILGRAAREVPAGMAREAGTEAIQTGIEQWGAAKPYDLREIVDSAGIGAVGGGLAGGGASLRAREQEKKPEAKPGVADILGAPDLDKAIDFSLEAVTAPAKNEDKPLELATGADGLPFEADPRFAGAPILRGGERPAAPVFGSKQQADIYIGEQALFQSHEAVEVAPGRWQAQPTAATRALLGLDKPAPLPTPDARELSDEERQAYANKVPLSYSKALRNMPQPEVSDSGVSPQDVGLLPTQSLDDEGNAIPAGEAQELYRLPRNLPVSVVDPNTPPAAPRDTIPAPAPRQPGPIPTGEATEFETLPVGEVLEGDLLARDGQPFGSKTGAQAKAYASGGGKVVAIPNHFGSGTPGYVVRPLMPGRPSNTRGTDARDLPRSSNVNQPDVAGTAGQPAADGAGRPDVAVGGELAAGRVASDATGQQPGTAAAVAPGSAGNAPAGAGNAPNTALTEAAPKSIMKPGFDSDAWQKDRDDRIKASREAGNTHLDKVPAYVETMRGKQIGYVHDPKVKGRILTVDNSGNVYVEWLDAYSQEKEGAVPMKYGKKTVMQTSLGPRDLKDYRLAPDAAPTAAGPALATGDRITLSGKSYTVVSASPSAVKLDDGEGGTRMVARNSKTFGQIQRLGERETITPAEDTVVGKNDAGETLYERKDGSRYRMRFDSPKTRPNGYPDFGGDLSPVEATPAPRTEATAPTAAPATEAPAAGTGRPAAAMEADGVKREPWTMTREEAATEYPGDEYDRMLNRSSDLGDIPYAEADRRARVNAMGQRKLWAKTRAQLEQEGKDAVKAARGDRAAVNKLKGTPEFANWRLKAMSLKGKEAIAAAERLARDYLAIHKDRVQEALMEGKDVPAEVLADYPDLKRPTTTPNAAAPASTQAPAQAGAPVAAAPASEVSASDPMKRLGMVMRRAGWEIDYIDLDLTGDQPKADIRVNRGDGRFVIAKVDGQGRAMFETFQRDRNLRMDPKNPQSRMAPHLDDTFLGRQKFEGARSMLRGMVTYLADNATNPVALADMKAAWAGVMAGPVNSDMPALPTPTAAPAKEAKPKSTRFVEKTDAVGSEVEWQEETADGAWKRITTFPTLDAAKAAVASQGYNADSIPQFESRFIATAKRFGQATPKPAAPTAALTPKAQAVKEKLAADRQPFEHAGLKVYPTKMRRDGAVVDAWAVQLPENKGTDKVLGDTLHTTIEAAKESAEYEAKRESNRKEWERKDKEEAAKREAAKEANRGKSVAQRAADFSLNQPNKLPPSAGLGTGTRRDAMDKAVEQGRAIRAETVEDTAAKSRDKKAVEAVSKAGYLLGLSNENIPVVKAGLEARDRLKADKYPKIEYRVYGGRLAEGPFHTITKIEYDYAVQRQAEQLADEQARPAPGAMQNAPATHKDPGEPAEPVTPAVVREAIKTGVQDTGRKPSAMRAELLADIDRAIEEAPDYGDYQALVKSMGQKDGAAVMMERGEIGAPPGYSRPKRTFKVEGDGVFTIQNSVRQLLKFRAQVEKSPGFKDRQAPGGLNERATDALDRRSTDAAIANMVEEGDFQAALDYAEAKEVDIGAVKLSKLLRDRLEKWQKDQESAKRMAEYQAAQEAGKPAPGSLAAMMAEKEAADGDMRGYAWALVKGGKVIRSGSLPKPEFAPEAPDTKMSYYKDMADKAGADLHIGGYPGAASWEPTDGLIFGMTWAELSAKQQKGGRSGSAPEGKMPKDAVLAYSPSKAPKAEPEPDDIPEAGVASQTFDQWVRAKYNGNEYKAKYLEEFGGDERRAILGAAIGTIDNDRKTPDLLKAARAKYMGELLDLPRETSISLDVWDALDNFAKVEAQRHFYDLDRRITRRTQDETRARVEAERIKKAPYEAAFAEVDAEIRRLDALPGPETQKQKDLSARRDRLREALYQIGQGKEPDGRLLRKVDDPEPLDLKGFTRTPRGNGAFDLSDGNMRVSVEPTERGKFQARFGSAKSSPHLQGEQAAVDWAAQYRKDATPAPATVKEPLSVAPAQQAAAILDAAAEPPKGKERLDVLKDVKAGAITPDEVAAAYPAKEEAAPAEKAAEPATETPTPPEATGPAPMPAVGGISMSLAQQAHAGTSFVPERRAAQERESFTGALRDAWDRAARIAGTDPAAIARITEVFTDVADGYRARYTATLQARSRVMSSMIAGPARFPVERNRKRMETERKRAEEAQQYLDRGIKRLIRAARGPIDNSPESELERVRLNLSQREELQETMKAANAALRKGDDDALADLGFSEAEIADLKKPDFAGRKGFPDYRLTNNNAEIRRLRERLKSAEERMQDAVAGPVETERPGVKIVEDATDDRLRLIFDGKPSEEVRNDLKANGFKWSPKNDAWQRQLTANAKYAAKQVLDKHYPAEPAAPDDGTRFSRRMTPAQRASNFDAWAAGADVVGSEDAAARGFKTGEAVVVEAYHGTARPDRVGTVFQSKRATSGPMAFFTSDPTLASSYAQGKEDTSIGEDYDGDYSQWFKVKTPGQRARDVAGAWWYLTPEQRDRITSLAPRVVSREDDEGNYSIELGDESVTNGVGNYEWEYRKTRNPLRALVENWLASGMLFNEEQEFLKVLKAAGFPMDQVEYDSPRAKYPAVYKTFVRMGNPLVTSDIPQRTRDALEQAAKRDRSRAAAGGADQWDKNTRTLREWVEQLNDPERGSYAWTSIPDKVTDVLKAQGYDGIIDYSGKGGGDIVAPVYIPFAETQVKSALGNRGTFDPSKKDILYSRAPGTTTGVPMEDARALTAAIREALPTAPPIQVHDSVKKAPETLRALIRKAGAENDVEAVYHEGEIHVFPSNIASIERMQFVVAHHEVRHHGLRSMLGPQMGPAMLRMYASNANLKAAADAKMAAGLADTRILAVEEALADMPVEDLQKLTGWGRIVAAARQWLRSVAAKLRRAGLNTLANAMDPEGWTDNDIAALVQRAENVSRGGAAPYSVGGTVFSSPESADQTQTPARPEAARAVDTGKRSPLTGKPLIDLLDAAGNRIETSHIAATADEALENYRQRPARQAAARAAAPAPTYAMPERDAKAEGSNWRRVRGQEFTSLDEDDGYLYHVTSAPAAGGVREQGLVPNAGGMFGGFYANYSAGKVFLTERSGVSYWQEKVGQQLEQAMDNPPAVVVLRIPKEKIKAALQPDTVGSGDAGAPAYYSTQAVFSRSPGATKVTAQDLVNSKGGVFDFNRLGETKQDRLRTIMDAGRPGWLGLLTRDQIADVYGAEIPPVKEYDQLTREMENQRSKIAQDADDLYNEWAKLPAETNDKLARLMLDATVYSVHPDGAFSALGRGNDAERQQVHARLKAQYALMGKEAQAVYGKVRDFHKGTLEQLRDALEARVTRQVENGQAKAAALTKIRQAFDAYLKEGPYFPLSRFGDFIVVGTRESDGERVVASYATAGEQAAAARTLEADGFTVKMKTAKTYSRETDGSAGKFIGDVLTTIGNLDMLDATVGGDVADLKTKLMDDVNQLFIKALPDLSYRKHFMHRKGTPGFSSDMMRGFASSAFHAASHIARLNHGDKMTFALQDAFTAIEQAPSGDFNLHSQVLNELTKRHDAALNPNTHPVAAMLNQVGFVMYLGLSPAAGLINMLQTVMVTMPHLGARYGFGKANGSLAKALADITTGAKANAKNGWNAAQSTKLTAAERAMMSELQDEGVIDLTQAHDLSAATGLDTGNVARSKAAFAMARAMKIVGWTFHIPEVMNRQVTALSAYRLEMEKTGDAEKAKDAAREAIKRTHFDYAASNRARFMQGNVARVMLQFKQYSQNMTYLLGRAAYQALKGESPEVRAIARRQLIATFAVTWGMAGALGLPGLGTVAGLIGMLVGAMDDDDEPYDWKVEFRNLMADTFGKEAGEVLSHGIPRALVPWDISNRVSLGDLWFRDSGREGQSPREAFATDAANILGPTAGTVLGLYTAADHMARGNWSKAAESVVPKFLRDPLKAIREGSDGVTSYNGEPLMDLTGAEVTGRLLGFAPARASEMYEGKAAVMNAKTAIEEKRQSLISRMAKARIDKDTDTAAELQPEIAAFNQRNPEFKITGATLAKAIMTRMRNRRNTEDGILLPRTKQSLRELGRFAEVE